MEGKCSKEERLQLVCIGLLLASRQQLEAVEHGHHHVGNHEIGPLAPDAVQRGPAVAGAFTADGQPTPAAEGWTAVPASITVRRFVPAIQTPGPP